MTSIEILKARFRAEGIDADRCLHIGHGKCIGKTILQTMTRLYNNPTKEKEVAYREFTIKYFELEKLFIAWDAKLLKNDSRTKYTLSKKKLPADLNAKGFEIVQKRIGNRGGPLEPVVVFTLEGVDRFLEYYQKKVAER